MNPIEQSYITIARAYEDAAAKCLDTYQRRKFELKADEFYQRAVDTFRGRPVQPLQDKHDGIPLAKAFFSN